MSLRFKACICYKAFQKRNIGENLECHCSASILKHRLLSDPTYSHWYINPSNLKRELSLCSLDLVKWYLLGLPREEVVKYKRVVPVVVRDVLKQFGVASGEEASSQDSSFPGVELSDLEVEVEEQEVEPTPVVMAPVETEKKKKEEVVVLSSEYRDALDNVINGPLEEFPATFSGVLEVILKTFEYKGFDVKKIQELVAYRQSTIKTGEMFNLTEDKKIQIAVSGKENLNQVILLCIALFNHRGNNLEAIKAGLTPLVERSFQALVNNLILKSNVMEKGSKTKSPNVLTLARIAAAFPIHALRLASSEKNTRKVINLSDVGLTFNKLGKIMSHPVAPSVLDKEMIERGAIWITFLASIRLNNLIGGKNKADPDRLWLFHQAALASPAVKMSDRTAFWNSALADGDTTLIKSSAVDAEKILRPILDNDLLDEIASYKLPTDDLAKKAE